MKRIHLFFPMGFFIAAIFTAAFSADVLYADQMMWMSEEKAQDAVGLLRGASFIRSFCAPCGDEHSEMVIIESIESVSTGRKQFWEVLINGEAVDLAYTYVRQDGKWVNLAYKLNFVPYENPIYLDAY